MVGKKDVRERYSERRKGKNNRSVQRKGKNRRQCWKEVEQTSGGMEAAFQSAFVNN